MSTRSDGSGAFGSTFASEAAAVDPATVSSLASVGDPGADPGVSALTLRAEAAPLADASASSSSSSPPTALDTARNACAHTLSSAQAASSPCVACQAAAAARAALPPTVSRQDDFPTRPTNYKDNAKSYVNDDGDLVPCDASNTTTTPYQHVIGSDPAKGVSSYTSFSAPTDTGKSYGAKTLTVDLHQLQADIDSGAVKGVAIVDNAALLAEIDARVAERAAEVAKPNLTAKKALAANKSLERATQARSNAARDNEVLIRGVVPAQYIKITDTPGASAAASAATVTPAAATGSSMAAATAVTPTTEP